MWPEDVGIAHRLSGDMSNGGSGLIDFGTAVVGAVAGIIGALLTFILRRRLASGDVRTTDAEALWREASSIRQSLLDQLAAAELKLTSRDTVIESRDKRISRLEQIIDEKDRRIASLELQIANLRRERRRTA